MRIANTLLLIATTILLNFANAAITTEDVNRRIDSKLSSHKTVFSQALVDKRSLRSINEDRNDDRSGEERGIIVSFFTKMIPGAKAFKLKEAARLKDDKIMFNVNGVFHDKLYKEKFKVWLDNNVISTVAGRGMLVAGVPAERVKEVLEQYVRYAAILGRAV